MISYQSFRRSFFATVDGSFHRCAVQRGFEQRVFCWELSKSTPWIPPFVSCVAFQEPVSVFHSGSQNPFQKLDQLGALSGIRASSAAASFVHLFLQANASDTNSETTIPVSVVTIVVLDENG